MAKQLGKRDNSNMTNTVLIQNVLLNIKSEKDTALYINRMESEAGRQIKTK